jgi:hypothetical protein
LGFFSLSISEVFVGGLLAVSGFRPTHLAESDKTTVGQIENGLADWTHDFSEVETPLLIKYVKIEQWGKQSEQKKIAKKDENVFYCPFCNI